ncbi:hypothetical protein Glove_186g20 [Diversispora epigaea]|uniref:Uncharacterized protein n=1 Tax=Diversispora epigaea TaxID=1348612 RepID=A0A397IVU7_9GLOM|nr:hypothetical protein Glove_186g20 [Diversispora epigaea]
MGLNESVKELRLKEVTNIKYKKLRSIRLSVIQFSMNPPLTALFSCIQIRSRTLKNMDG